MSKTPPCYLTTSDFGALESLIESDSFDHAFLHLLRRKLTSATLVSDDTLEDAVAAVGRRVEFQIDGAMVDSSILSHAEEAAHSRLKLPITTMRGLALLGLREAASITIENGDGSIERLQLIKVYPGPRQRPAEIKVRSKIVGIDRGGARAARNAIDPDDDPGPQAA
jgi:regulator of nucleoside diphosphate kinase